jgi:hypothetical protein
MTAVKKLNEAQRKVSSSEFQLDSHRYQRFDCITPTGINKENITEPQHWVNVAGKLRVFDEIRCISEDHSFVAYLIVTFVQGTDVKLKLVNGAELESFEGDYAQNSKYDVVLRGTHKWCIIDTSTGDVLFKDIATKAKAYKELEDYTKALNS